MSLTTPEASYTGTEEGEFDRRVGMDALRKVTCFLRVSFHTSLSMLLPATIHKAALCTIALW
jgi:hypothetical protein